MKTMSIAQYAEEMERAKTPLAKASLFVRSLGLRFKLWNTKRVMDREYARQRRERRRAGAKRWHIDG